MNALVGLSWIGAIRLPALPRVSYIAAGVAVGCNLLLVAFVLLHALGAL